MPSRFDLPCELTIYNVAQTQSDLLAWLAARQDPPPAPLELGAAQVIEVDGAGMQLLCAFSALMARRTWEWRLVDPAPCFDEVCRTLGLAEWLGRHTALEPT